MIFKNNKNYDVWKWIVSPGLPALAAFILAIGQIWGWTDLTVPIGATIAALATFLGALLGISSIKYHNQIEKGGK